MKGFFHAGNTAGYTYEEIFFASIIRQAQTIRQVIPKRAVPTGNLSKTAGKTSVVSAVMQKITFRIRMRLFRHIYSWLYRPGTHLLYILPD